ncbi:glycosyltransferase family 4 protein [Mesorhizobium sp. M1006]|uniref:glycosyltransferase family 4 protein n=1 Tax=Mesorhizobium sp. M1006 TaxID=2957048 RepID=UPI0033388E5D
MKILVYSHVFPPSVGGTEEVVRLLVEEFCRAGHEIVVATRTLGEGIAREPYRVVRRPTFIDLLRLGRESEVAVLIGVSLRAAPALLLLRRPFVISHHVYLERWPPQRVHHSLPSLIALKLKRWISSRAQNVYTSRGFMRADQGSGIVIRNPFDIKLFRPALEKDRDIVFVGRMIPEKGCSDLVDALKILKAQKIEPTVTLIGDGPERESLEQRVKSAGLQDTVTFTGVLTGELLARMVARHRISVVPSRWPEPFGIVALEAIASGCVVVGTDGGGLPEAIGPCGMIVRPNEPSAIAAAMKMLLNDRREYDRYSRAGSRFTAYHAPYLVAQDYLTVLGRIARGPSEARPMESNSIC